MGIGLLLVLLFGILHPVVDLGDGSHGHEAPHAHLCELCVTGGPAGTLTGNPDSSPETRFVWDSGPIAGLLSPPDPLPALLPPSRAPPS
jgi:hypothetical protein